MDAILGDGFSTQAGSSTLADIPPPEADYIQKVQVNWSELRKSCACYSAMTLLLA